MGDTDLYKVPADAEALPPHHTEAGPTPCTALFVHCHLVRRTTPILDSFVALGSAKTPLDLVVRFDTSLDHFEDALPAYFRFFPHTDTRWDPLHPYLPAHRLRLHNTLLSYRQTAHRTHMHDHVSPLASLAIRTNTASICLCAIRVQRSSKLVDAKISGRLFNPQMVFESGVCLCFLMQTDKILGVAEERMAPTPDWMIWREAVGEAIELLDGWSISAPLDPMARPAERVLRELLTKVDKPVMSVGRLALVFAESEGVRISLEFS